MLNKEKPITGKEQVDLLTLQVVGEIERLGCTLVELQEWDIDSLERLFDRTWELHGKLPDIEGLDRKDKTVISGCLGIIMQSVVRYGEVYKKLVLVPDDIHEKIFVKDSEESVDEAPSLHSSAQRMAFVAIEGAARIFAPLLMETSFQDIQGRSWVW